MPHTVHYFYDLLSPYSYLATELLARNEGLQREELLYTPVVFGTMLARRGAKGPGEDPLQREIGLTDVMLRAEQLGIPFEGTPTHPFNSVIAMRSIVAIEDPVQRRRLTETYFRLGWRDGEQLEDFAVLRKGLAECGLSQDPEAIVSDSAVRQKLKKNTEFALSKGVTGVPTFLVDDILFFGGDRIELLELYLTGKVRLDREKVTRILTRQGVQRIV